MDAILWLAAVVVLLVIEIATLGLTTIWFCLLYTSPSPRDAHESRMPSSA